MTNNKKLKSIYLFSLISLIIILVIAGMYITKTKYNNKETKKEFLYNNLNNLSDSISNIYVLNNNKHEHNYDNYKSMFSSMGFDVVDGALEEFNLKNFNNNILIITNDEAKKLTEKEITIINDKVSKGLNLIIDNKSKLSKSFGIEYNKSKKINSYSWMNHPDIKIKLRDTFNVDTIVPDERYNIISESTDNEPVSIMLSYNKGKVFYSAIPIITSNMQNGYENYPFLNEVVVNEFKVKPSIEKNNLCIYLDIYFHVNEKPKEIVNKISQWGIKQVNMSTWQIDEYPEFARTFITEAHKRGILVYGWVEYPMAGITFWNEHPEWREKTAALEDAHIDWRYLMALEDDECLDALKEDLKDTLIEYDFDGVDIAEIYFESPGYGLDNINKFTPMHDSFRSKFQEEFKYDPLQIFDVSSKYFWRTNKESKEDLLNFRCDLVTTLHEEFLKLSEEIKEDKPYFDTCITVIDSISDKNMKENIGVDMQPIIKMQNKYSFTLQIEDPYTLWSLGPQRYKVIGEEYNNLIDNDKLKLAIDINIIDRYGDVFPTSKQHGLEVMQLIYNASEYTDKVIMYAICTLDNFDGEFIKYAQRNKTNVSENKDNYYSESDTKFTFDLDTKNHYPIVDDKLWSAVTPEKIIIPNGAHNIIISDVVINSSDILLENINVDDFICNTINGGIEICYNSNNRCYITVKNKFSYVKLDDKIISPNIYSLKDNRYTIELPSGQHRVIVSNNVYKTDK